jgi:hypothetical protein
MKLESYKSILSEMETTLHEFSTHSGSMDAYTYEKEFREITDSYNLRLFQASIGSVPASKNEKNTVLTGFGNIEVKKKTVR